MLRSTDLRRPRAWRVARSTNGAGDGRYRKTTPITIQASQFTTNFITPVPVSFSLNLSSRATNIWRSDPHRTTFRAAASLNKCLCRALAIATVVFAALQSAQAQPGYTVSVKQLEQEVAQRFPLRYPMAGLIDLDVRAPQLRLMPELNRVSAKMAVEATGPALRRSHSGTFDVDFSIRYESSDRTIRAYRLHFQNLRISDLQPQASELLNAYGLAMANQALQEVVLHQLRPQDLAMADTLGMQPGSITVTDKGLVIGFVLKPL